jgi:hypothetical protein
MRIEKILLVFVQLPVMLYVASTDAQQSEAELTKEIKRIRKELMSVQDERGRVKEEAEKDVEDFREYRKRTQTRLQQVRSETDSLRELIGVTKSDNDSLAAVVEAEKTRARQYDLLQDDFSKAISAACDRALAVAENGPPIATGKHVSALNLLKGELQNKSVDNIEGVARLTQVLRDMVDLTSTIQIVQGSSPLPEIRGTTYRIRLGSFFEAVVNVKGTQAALWTGYDENGSATWTHVTDPVVAGQILKAVNVREGKSLPALVDLPLDNVEVVKGD